MKLGPSQNDHFLPHLTKVLHLFMKVLHLFYEVLQNQILLRTDILDADSQNLAPGIY
jgi:hypothetical protein